MDGGAWWATVHGVSMSRSRLSDFTFTFHFHAKEKEMATHSSVLAWRIPGMAEPGGLLSMGSHRVGHDWSDLTAAAAKRVHKIQYYYWNAWPFLYITLHSDRSFTGGSVVKNPPVMQKMPRVWFLGREDPLEEGMATHSSILALENPMDRGVWQATVHRVAQSWTWLKQPSMHTY